MGSGVSSRRYLKFEEESLRHQILETTVYRNGKEIFGLESRYVDLCDGKLCIREIDDGEVTVASVPMDDKLEIIVEKQREKFEIIVRESDYTFLLSFKSYERLSDWYRFIQEEIVILKSKLIQGQSRGIDHLMDMFGSLETNPTAEETAVPTHVSSRPTDVSREKVYQFHDTISPPKMKIVILVVGTRGDVQPFVNLALEFKSRGHVVRIATHSEYRQDVIKEGLLYYPLAGDPRKLSEYMVKSSGRLLPDLLSEEERNQLPEKMQMLRDIIFSTWPACTQSDPDDPDHTPFIAEAIISNPVSYGHIHCAEALAVPLHIMFPQPWYPTKSFPHPLSNMGFESNWSLKNRLSYRVVDEFMWLGLGSIINDFRKKSLQLLPIRPGEGGESMLQDLEVPISHMWSPSFVPRCIDWPSHIDVVGDFTRLVDSPCQSTYQPHEKLHDFLSSCEDMKPIYIGFGSMVISNADGLVKIIKEAAVETGYPVILQSGWTKYAEDYEFISERVMVVGAMPHDWLFQQVSAVIHHGGAGTTSAGLRAGNPTFICPFFGDQHFWGEMVYRSGAGPPGCPITSLTLEKLIHAFHVLASPDTRNNVKALSERMNSEKGVLKGVESFFRNLPLEDMICEVSLFRQQSEIASIYCRDCGLKMSSKVDEVIHRLKGGKQFHLRVPYRCVKWGVDPPSCLLEGLQQGFGVAVYEIAGGFYDLVAKPIEGGRERGAKGVAQGVAQGVVSFIARPIKGGQILIDRVSQSVSNEQVRRNRTVNESLKHKLPPPSPAGTGSGNDGASTVAQRAQLHFKEEGNTGAGAENQSIDATREDTADDLSEEENQIEEALGKALYFRDLWTKLDTSGDRMVNLDELRSIIPQEEAEALLQTADSNDDGELTFAELASTIIRHCGTSSSRLSSKKS